MSHPESDKPAMSFREAHSHLQVHSVNGHDSSESSDSDEIVANTAPSPFDLAQLNPTDNTLIIGIVAGEASGDILGADFMRQMNNLRDDVIWIGVGGPKMQAQGLQSLFALQRLAVMGLVEVMAHLPDLFKARSELVAAFDKAKIDWFVGIDAPDFNLRVAKKLKPKGVFCVQYVSPSIWAWRESRIHSIKKATHLVLCLFPFELSVYARYDHPAVCVGHPLLHTTSQSLLQTPVDIQRRELVWKNEALQQFFSTHDQNISQLICMLPGSRRGEINTLLPVMLDAMNRLLLVDKDLCFIIPTVDKNHQQIVRDKIHKFSKNTNRDNIKGAVVVAFDDSQKHPHFSQSIMTISDIIVLASGTATLEAMLVNRPMVVVYKLNELTYKIASRLVKVPYIALPNILADKCIVPELIQDDATGGNICREVSRLLQPRGYEQQKSDLASTTQRLHQQSTYSPALAVVDAWVDLV